MSEITTEEQDKFLEELTNLSRKHGIRIHSLEIPYLVRIKPEGHKKARYVYMSYGFSWIDPDEIAAFEEYLERIKLAQVDEP